MPAQTKSHPAKQTSFISHAALIAAFAGTLVASIGAHAEYRAYQLAIVDSTTGQKRTVISILDDLQYPTYHPIRSTERVTIEAHWRCTKRSDISQDPLQQICPNPHPNQQSGAREPANQESK
jgi:hypothetical protein